MTAVTATEVVVEEPSVKDQAGKVLAHIAGYVGARTIEIGLARGLVGTLARHPDGMTTDELAAEAGLDAFYVEVWCRSGLANDVLQRSGDRANRLAPHMATVLLDRESPARSRSSAAQRPC